jgi:hypothetical protein
LIRTSHQNPKGGESWKDDQVQQTAGGIHNIQWKSFLFKSGQFIEENRRLAPRTADLLRRIPNLYTAFFSVLDPHQHIAPHFGYYKGFLRYHLGIIISNDNADGGCYLRVNANPADNTRRERSLIDKGVTTTGRTGKASCSTTLSSTTPTTTPTRWGWCCGSTSPAGCPGICICSTSWCCSSPIRRSRSSGPGVGRPSVSEIAGCSIHRATRPPDPSSTQRRDRRREQYRQNRNGGGTWINDQVSPGRVKIQCKTRVNFRCKTTRECMIVAGRRCMQFLPVCRAAFSSAQYSTMQIAVFPISRSTCCGHRPACRAHNLFPRKPSRHGHRFRSSGAVLILIERSWLPPTNNRFQGQRHRRSS